MKEHKDTIYKTVYQYNQVLIPDADMEKLLELARDCREVRNSVYERYSGIRGLSRIYPGYTAQNEMTKSGIRERLGLPSVYFYLSIFDALGDIKSQWTHTKKQIEKNIRANPNLTPEDRHYLRYVMKQSQCFETILVGEEPIPEEKRLNLKNFQSGICAAEPNPPDGTPPGGGMRGKMDGYAAVCADVDTHRLDQYLRRQVRRHLERPHTEAADGFPASPKGYRYADHGIYLTTKERGKRLFIPLTDNNRYDRQIYIRLYPEERKIRISVPVEIRQRHPEGYEGELGLALGLECMFVTDRGRAYGGKYWEYQTALTDYVRERLPRHQRNAKNNPGMKKYNTGKARLERAMHGYVNAEINRMLETEKPGTVYIPKLPPQSKAGYNRRLNAIVNMWQKGFIKSRLVRKCRERSIELVEVFGKGISSECSRCGADGVKEGDMFCCPCCGMKLPERQNTAGNVLKRGRMLKEERDHREMIHETGLSEQFIKKNFADERTERMRLTETGYGNRNAGKFF